jgi:Cd2+/Zn2+-exporting ATPase
MGIGACSRNGILVKGNNYLELLNKCNCVCFDKTGTITTGRFEVKELKLYGIEEKELIECVLCAEKGSLHPFAESFRSKYNNYECDLKISKFREEKGKGVSCIVNGKVVLVGNDTWMKENDIKFESLEGIVMYVSIDGVHKGTILFEDEIKEDAYIFVDELKKRNVNEIMMLSGYKKENVIKVARELDIKSKGELLPEDKLRVVKELKDKGNTCLYLGDGINDAPVLVEANVGVSMGNFGSDAAIECSDIVIVDDNPYKIIKGMEISRKTKRVLWMNIIFALTVKFIIMLLAMFNISSLPLAIFGDVGVTLITIFNCLSIKQ